MQYLEFNKTICGVHIELNAIDFQSECPFDLSQETVSADYFQIFFFKKVDGFLRLNDSSLELEDNSVVFISKHQHHSWHIDYTKLEGQLLLFQDEFLNNFFSDQYFIFRLLYFYQTQYPLKIQINETYMQEHLNRLSEIKHELVHPKSDSVHLIRSLLYYILIDLNRKYAASNAIEEAIALDNTAYQFRKSVEQHIKEYQRVEEYAAMMQTSRISLNKAVKKQFNVTATSFIKSRLVFELKMKLIHTTRTIAELADEYHFSEANHLSRFFKQKTGSSPLEYRSTYMNGILS